MPTHIARAPVARNSSAPVLLKAPTNDDALEPASPLSRSIPTPAKAHFAFERQGYILHETIGCGGYSKVKVATHLESGEKVAVKIINKLTAPPGYLKKFLAREVETLRAIRHPCVCALKHVVETTERVYLVLQHAPRGDLLDHINHSGAMAPSEVRDIFLQLVGAVDHCHNQQVVHRDIKCENILMTTNGGILLSDFGFATQVPTHQAKLHTHCGSYAYAAPEVLGGLPYRGAVADVWSMGVVLYAMACGRLPFPKGPPPRGSSPANVFKTHSSRCIYFPRNISKPLQSLIRRMLTVDVDARITLPEVLRHPWIEDAALEAAQAHPEWELEVPQAPRRSRARTNRASRGLHFHGLPRRHAANCSKGRTEEETHQYKLPSPHQSRRNKAQPQQQPRLRGRARAWSTRTPADKESLPPVVDEEILSKLDHVLGKVPPAEEKKAPILSARWLRRHNIFRRS